MSKQSVYIDGKKIPNENIVSVNCTDKGTIIVELIYEDKKEKIRTDSSVRKIELK